VKDDFQMARKLFPRQKNAPLQLKKQNMAKFKTFSRTEMSSLEVLKAKNRCSTALFLSRRYQNVVETTFQMNFIDGILILFLLYSTQFTADTLHATLNTLVRLP